MTIFALYQQYKNRWWALPLILPLLLMPLVRQATTYTEVEGGIVVLYYMPLAFLLALTLFYGLAALPQ